MLRGVLALLAILLIVPALLYVPAVQEFARRQAVKAGSQALGMQLSIGRIRLAFPLRLDVAQIRLVDRTDTLVDCGRIALDIDPWPLIRKKAVIRSFGIDRVSARYRDTATGFEMRIAAGRLAVERASADLRHEKASVARIALDSAAIRLRPGASAAPEKPDTTAPLHWAIDLAALSIRNTSFEMESSPAGPDLSVAVADAAADSCRVALAERQVDVSRIRFDRGVCSYLMAASGHPSETPPADNGAGNGADNGADNGTGRASDKEPETSGTEENWTVRVGSIALTDNRITYGTRGHRPTEGFDPACIALSGVELTVDSLYNRGSDIALQLRQLALTERCGLTVERTRGDFEMGPEGIALTGFELATTRSHIAADLTAGAGVLRQDPDAPLTIGVQAEVNTSEIARLAPAMIPAPLDNRLLRLHFSAAGSLEELGKVGLDVSSPGLLTWRADGEARSLLDPQRMNASVRFRGDFGNLAVLSEILPDTALRRRIALPEGIGWKGSAAADRGSYSLSSVLTAGEGLLGVEGRIDPRAQRYEAELRCDSFPVNRFLPADSIGRIDLTLRARGRGFDPLRVGTEGQIRLEVEHAEYRRHDFGGITVEAGVAEQRLTGRISDRDSALRIALGLEGTLNPERQQARLSGRIGWFDLAALGFVSEPIGGIFHLDAEAAAAGPGCYDARITLDSIAIRNGTQVDRIRPTSVAFRTDSTMTRVDMQSGDLQLAFRSPEPLDSLKAALPRSVGELMRQVQIQRVDMDSLKPALPDFRLQLTAGPNNILNNYLRTKKASFRALDLRGENCDTLPVRLTLRVDALVSGGIRLDTVQAALRQRGPQLAYALRVANTPSNPVPFATAGLYGDVVRNTARLNLYQRDRNGREGIRSGIDALWNDSLVQVSVRPDPQFGFAPWSVNPGNYLVYRFNRTVDADLDLTHADQCFSIHAGPDRTGTDEIRIRLAGLGIGAILGMLPSAPPVDGVLGADLAVEMAPDTLALDGALSVAGLTYEKQRFGDLALTARYTRGVEQQAGVRLLIDSIEALRARARYRDRVENPLDVTVSIPGFPLQRANVFLPADLVQLSGTLSGKLSASGSAEHPLLNGGLRFAGTQVRVPMIGTAFRLAEDTIRIAESRVMLDHYALLAPNRAPLTIHGEADLSDLSRIRTDLSFRAADFQFVNVPRKEKTTVYGEAYLDLNASAKGPVDELVIRGNVALLGGTDINYVMQDSPMDVKERPQSVVTFVPFRELDAQEPAEEIPPVRIGGMDIALNVDISNDVKAAVDLSTDGSNRIDLRGGGNLAYTMNPLGDTRLSGRYVLSGGTVRYNPPVIAQKVFQIKPGGYVEWLGDLADPSFNITAVETVRANVSSDDGQESRPVNFDISINIRNTLNDLEISFGLAAPEDLTMQNQLNSLTAEQRANQAMNLLIYNTYTGPGTTAKVSSENPLNTFIQNELNQWAQNNLKGVDLSFGIDSYGQDDPNGQRTDYSYRLSKNLFSNRIRAVIGGKFSTDSDPTQNLKENLIDDISLEYMLDKRDNMYIRIFRHTGYESILEGEITETGVGFVIRKKLSRLGDLFRPTRPEAKKQRRHEDDAH